MTPKHVGAYSSRNSENGVVTLKIPVLWPWRESSSNIIILTCDNKPRKIGKRAHRGNNPIRTIYKTIFTVYIVEFMKFGTFNLTSNRKHEYSSTGHYLYTNKHSRFNYDSIYQRISVVNSNSAINPRNRFPRSASMDVSTWQQAMGTNMGGRLIVCLRVIREPVCCWKVMR